MRFIGCKEKLIPFIDWTISQKNIRGNTFCDLFAGTASVGKHFKSKGFKIVSNDFLHFSYVLQYAYLKVKRYPKFSKLLKHLDIKVEKNTLFSSSVEPLRTSINYLNTLEGTSGFIYKNYSDKGTKGQKIIRKFFTSSNAQKIDVIRQTIENWKNSDLLNNDEYYLLLASVIEAVPFVSNISGTYGSFLKKWDKRAFKTLTLEAPEIIKDNKEHLVYNQDAFDLIKNINVDILYLDPPYNNRQYAPNYHILETISRWDNPEISGVAGLRDWSSQKSRFCVKSQAPIALEEITEKAKFKYLILSYNNEGILSEKQILNILSRRGKVDVIRKGYQRFKSNSGGSGHTNTNEILYILKKIDPRNKLNDLSGSEWTYFLNSVEETNYLTNGDDSYAHHIRSKHPSPKPPQLMKKIIEFFTKEGERVLDPFMGVGGTLIGCSLSNRKGVGIDLSKSFVGLYKEANKELGLIEQKTHIGDSKEIKSILKDRKESFDLILTDPPYGDMLSKGKTGQRKKGGNHNATPFTESENDLGNMGRERFLASLQGIIEKSLYYLKLKGYLIVFVKDLQPTDDSINLLHAEVANTLFKISGLRFRGYKIWYDKTQKLYPFGYPYVFVANQFHQYILIFRKEEK